MGEKQAPSSSVKSGWKKESLTELVGTYVLVVIGPASIIATSALSISEPLALCLVALAFGGTVSMVILGIGRYSGSIINPAITLAAASANLLRKELVVPYLLFQMTGGILAGLTLRLMFLSLGNSTKLGSTILAGSISPDLGIALEAIGTFVLSSSALIATIRIRQPRYQALLVGTTLFVLILLIGPLTGAGFNPARSLGPSLASGYFPDFYVYIVGPIIGATLAGVLFRSYRG
jgi:MIP family channel proteins